MAQKAIKLNDGAQQAFVMSEAESSGYFGGVGAGKTFAGLVKAVMWSQQPFAAPETGEIYGPRGLVAAISYDVLKDVVYPQFFSILDGTGLLLEFKKQEKKAFLKANCGCKPSKRTKTYRLGDKVVKWCGHIAEIQFRSLDKPDWMRGRELSYFFIDEGRHVNRNAWNVLKGRLRQKGYNHAGWVCSTPNGYDWMWAAFHPENQDSEEYLNGSEWFNAPTKENKHLPPAYIADLEANYHGRFYEQEVEGRFVGVVEGQVFPDWDMPRFTHDVPYREDLPLYSLWDWGIGDLGVCLFMQIEWEESPLLGPNGVHLGTHLEPHVRFIGAIEGKDMNAQQWVDKHNQFLREVCGGRVCDENWGDPAGTQRSPGQGTSMFEDLAAAGLVVYPAPRKPKDFGFRILGNLMAGGNIEVDKDHAARLAAAFSSHKWSVDTNGQKVGTDPVHDWTSHFADAARYGAAALLDYRAPRARKPSHQAPKKNASAALEDLFKQVTKPREHWLGQQAQTITYPVQVVMESNGR